MLLIVLRIAEPIYDPNCFILMSSLSECSCLLKFDRTRCLGNVSTQRKGAAQQKPCTDLLIMLAIMALLVESLCAA